jgi:hypothetical protein
VAAQPSGALFGYLFDSDLALTNIHFSHPFAATNYQHTLYAQVKNNWPFSDPISNIKVNFSVDGIYIGTGTIPYLVPGESASCGVNFIFNKEKVYNIKAEIVGPNLNEFFSDNNDLETSIIVVDPVILTSQPDFGTGLDTFVSHLDSKLSFGDQYNLKVGRVSSAGGYGSGIGISRSFIRFDTTGIPRNAIVIDADLELYMYKSVGGNLKITAHQVPTGWGEINNTWDTQPSYNGSIIDSLVVGTNSGYKSWEVTSAAKYWVANPSRNNGIMLKSSLENTYWWKEFYSTDTENGLRPKLVVKYAMLKNALDITKAVLSVADYQDKELRLEWTPVPYALYYDIYRSDKISGPYTKLGSTWDFQSKGGNGSLDTFFYDDVDGGYPEPPVTITTDRGGQAGTIRVSWLEPSAPAASMVYYYRIRAYDVENKVTDLSKSPTVDGQVTPEIVKYQIFNSTSYWGPWSSMLVETDKLSYSHSGLGPGKLMYYRIKSISSEGYISVLSKTVWDWSNRPPVISNLYVSPTTAYTTDYLLANYTFTDQDGDLESGTQIRWYCNGNLISWYNDKAFIYPWSTKKDQVWYFTVNPKDGIEFGTIATSGMRTILNSPPELTNFQITPSKPLTTDKLTLGYTFSDADKDTETGTTILWYKNGVHKAKYDDLTSIPSSATTKNEVWNVTIRVGDGTDFSPWIQVPAVTIENSPPSAINLQISPSNPRTNDPLKAVYTYFDADSDSEMGTNIEWYKDDQLQSTFTNKLIIPSTATQKGEVWHFTIKPSDNEDFGLEVKSPSVKIGNTVPSITDLKIYPEAPTTSDFLWIQYTFIDADGDPELDSIIKWYRDDQHVDALDNYVQIPAMNTKRGEQWYCTVTPSDGFILGETIFSDTITIINSPPEITLANIEPTKPAVADTLIAKYEYQDADNDEITEYLIKWYMNGIEQSELQDQLEVPATATSGGEVWHLEIQVSDGFDFGAVYISSSVTINNPPTVKNLIINPASPTSSDSLTGNYDWHDPDAGDVEEGTMIEWYRNGELIGELSNLLEVPVEYTQKGDTWYFNVKPSDGLDSGTIIVSDSMIIGNSAPEALDLEIIKSDNSLSDILIAFYSYIDLDDDPEQESIIKWYKNDELVEELKDSPFVPTKLLKRGDIWYFTVRPYDGDDYGLMVKSSMWVVDNVAPIIELAVIIPQNPKTIDEIEAYIEYNDQDNDNPDNFRIEFQWYKNEILQDEANGWVSIPPAFTTKGDVWYYTVRIYDGFDWTPLITSTSVTIENTAPEVTEIIIKPENPVSGKPLALDYEYSDYDNDIEAGTEIRWYRNDELVPKLNDNTEVPIEYLNMGDDWYCSIQPKDGIEFGELKNSIKATINTIPEIDNIIINPSTPTDKDNLTLIYEYFDKDNDFEGNTEINWYRNDEHETRYDNMITIHAVALKKNDNWYAVIRPHDGKEFGTVMQSEKIQILTSEPLDINEGSTDKAGDNNITFVWLILIIIIIIILFLFIFYKRSKKRQISSSIHEEQEQFEDQIERPIQTTSEIDSSIIAKPPIQIESKQIPKEPVTTKAIPIAELFRNGIKSSDQELSDDTGQLPYDEIDIEFRCNNCESEIDPDLESCPICGEEFGSLM